jgi:beta-galactosidase
LQGGTIKDLPYNLSDSARAENSVNRIFKVDVNNVPLLQNFNIMKEYCAARPIIKKTKVAVVNSTGITITFKPVEGEAVSNAVQLKKLD